MKLRFWGTRGSLPSPGPETVRYGGNTSCLQVETNQTLVILDCGTGARPLGRALMNRPGPIRGHLFLSHTHWDHIQGFPFFTPLLTPGNDFTVYAAAGRQSSLRDVLAGQMEPRYFPIELDQLQSPVKVRDLGEETVRLSDLSVTSQFLNHTTATLGYRLEYAGCSVVYATDTEPFGHFRTGEAEPEQAFAHEGDRRLAAFARGADVLVMDAQYTADEYREKKGWGHSPLEYAVELALTSRVRRLALFHHDIERTDAEIAALESRARSIAEARGSSLEVFAAAEGLELTLSTAGAAELPRHTAPVVDDGPRVPSASAAAV